MIDVENLYNRRNDHRWDRMVVGDIVERMAHGAPDRVAFIAAPEAIADPRFARVTYGEAEQIANGIANSLLAHGLERGDRVAMLCDNSVEAYLTKLGIAKAGLVAAPINVMMAGDIVEAMLLHVGARCAIVDGDLWDAAAAVFKRAGVDPLATVRANASGPVAGTLDFADFAAAGGPTAPEVRIHGDDIWEILLTSGTTALPKAVMVSHTYSYTAAMGHAISYTRGLKFESDFRTCTFLPVIYHVGDHASVLSSLLCGGSIVFGRKPSGSAIARAITREAVTCLWAGSVAFMGEVVRAVNSSPQAFDLRSLTSIVYGWSTPPPGLVAELERICGDVRLVGLFGQTEAIACHRFWPDRWPETFRRTAPEVNYVGLPISLLDSVIVDENGASLSEQPGLPGEAVYRSPAITSGYFRNQEATETAFRDGWFHSGDSCMYDEDGLRIMVDRYKDIIKSGGENVSTIRVESVLSLYPGIESVAVIGVPDERWGESVTAIVTLTDGAAIVESEAIAFCRQRLAGFETPKRVIVLAEMPTTVGGKILKYRLREMFTAGTSPVTDYGDLLYAEADGICEITINRPDRGNAFREQTIHELIDAFDRADASRGAGVIVFSGTGDQAFSTGGDVGMENEFHPDEGRRVARLLIRLTEAMRGTGKPTIAKIRGWCVGGGNELNLMCDLSVAAESARFAHTDARLGNSPIWFGTQLMARLVGEKLAKEIIMLGEVYSAADAARMGWINRAVPDAELDAFVTGWAQRLLGHSPQSMRLTKTSINAETDPVIASVRQGFEALTYIYGTDEFHEGTQAFLDKRAPRFRPEPT